MKLFDRSQKLQGHKQINKRLGVVWDIMHELTSVRDNFTNALKSVLIPPLKIFEQVNSVVDKQP